MNAEIKIPSADDPKIMFQAWSSQNMYVALSAPLTDMKSAFFISGFLMSAFPVHDLSPPPRLPSPLTPSGPPDVNGHVP